MTGLFEDVSRGIRSGWDIHRIRTGQQKKAIPKQLVFDLIEVGHWLQFEIWHDFAYPCLSMM